MFGHREECMRMHKLRKVILIDEEVWTTRCSRETHSSSEADSDDDSQEEDDALDGLTNIDLLRIKKEHVEPTLYFDPDSDNDDSQQPSLRDCQSDDEPWIEYLDEPAATEPPVTSSSRHDSFSTDERRGRDVSINGEPGRSYSESLPPPPNLSRDVTTRRSAPPHTSSPVEDDKPTRTTQSDHVNPSDVNTSDKKEEKGKGKAKATPPALSHSPVPSHTRTASVLLPIPDDPISSTPLPNPVNRQSPTKLSIKEWKAQRPDTGTNKPKLPPFTRFTQPPAKPHTQPQTASTSITKSNRLEPPTQVSGDPQPTTDQMNTGAQTTTSTTGSTTSHDPWSVLPEDSQPDHLPMPVTRGSVMPNAAFPSPWNPAATHPPSLGNLSNPASNTTRHQTNLTPQPALPPSNNSMTAYRYSILDTEHRVEGNEQVRLLRCVEDEPEIEEEWAVMAAASPSALVYRFGHMGSQSPDVIASQISDHLQHLTGSRPANIAVPPPSKHRDVYLVSGLPQDQINRLARRPVGVHGGTSFVLIPWNYMPGTYLFSLRIWTLANTPENAQRVGQIVARKLGTNPLIQSIISGSDTRGLSAVDFLQHNIHVMTITIPDGHTIWNIHLTTNITDIVEHNFLLQETRNRDRLYLINGNGVKASIFSPCPWCSSIDHPAEACPTALHPNWLGPSPTNSSHAPVYNNDTYNRNRQSQSSDDSNWSRLNEYNWNPAATNGNRGRPFNRRGRGRGGGRGYDSRRGYARKDNY
ncbi:hypothetical protein E1B28_008021 [Marasmius oreades]|uniref:Uncharacterized protein n=1 Tax=Marasmius oreades TaxID=181124 RepID=A0A9P7S2U2_9AGAR|nr:uncharacterized protein E1B28_008021 [Marasmius oreades]KAG7094421.1 hypothetical protein E1B28_008021 [Marasmius oreades]